VITAILTRSLTNFIERNFDMMNVSTAVNADRSEPFLYDKDFQDAFETLSADVLRASRDIEVEIGAETSEDSDDDSDPRIFMSSDTPMDSPKPYRY
jgi:hypothetical protein